MTNRIATLTLASLLGALPTLSRAQYDGGQWTDDPPQTAQPDAAPTPTEAPPAPPPEAAAPVQPAPQAATPAGQWVYTQQYGWIWMPYSDTYTYVPADGYGQPYTYVYYPATACWTWIAAPWVWGFGPWPYFGVVGPVHYAWYSHGYWREPARWHYAPSYGYRGAPYVNRAAPAPYRGGSAAPFRGGSAPRAPAFRGTATYGGPAFRGGVAPAPYRGSSGVAFRGAAPAARGGGFVAAPRSAGHGGGWSAPRSGGGSHGFGGGGRGHR